MVAAGSRSPPRVALLALTSALRSDKSRSPAATRTRSRLSPRSSRDRPDSISTSACTYSTPCPRRPRRRPRRRRPRPEAFRVTLIRVTFIRVTLIRVTLIRVTLTRVTLTRVTVMRVTVKLETLI